MFVCSRVREYVHMAATRQPSKEIFNLDLMKYQYDDPSVSQERTVHDAHTYLCSSKHIHKHGESLVSVDWVAQEY